MTNSPATPTDPQTPPTSDASVASAKPTGLKASQRTALLGAMFLMATSAIGPGFITQTSEFTVKLGAAFAFAIVVSILVDIAVQLNVWRVIGVSGRRAQDLGNAVIPGVGWVLAGLVFIGGLVFNIGNIAGTGLGMNAMTGLDPKIGGAISAVLAIAVFISKKAGMALDRIVVLLGALMILLMLYVAIVSAPPVGEALRNVVIPAKVDFLVITTLIGGTAGATAISTFGVRETSFLHGGAVLFANGTIRQWTNGHTLTTVAGAPTGIAQVEANSGAIIVRTASGDLWTSGAALGFSSGGTA